MNELNRREFLSLAGASALGFAAGPILSEKASGSRISRPELVGKADRTIRIATGLVEVAPDKILSMTTYNDVFPGPLLRLKEGRKVTVDIYNDTDMAEVFHWHGQRVPVEVDGSAEEGTPLIPAHGMRRLVFTPKPAGFRFYHTHSMAGNDLMAGQYSGQVGPLYIEPRNEPGAYDKEVFLTLKEFMPAFSKGGDMAMDFLRPATTSPELKKLGDKKDAEAKAKGKEAGYEVGYDVFTINGKMLGNGEPIRVRQGQRVLLHILNGSAGETRSLALPGHTFKVVALDGNPVPNPTSVPVLWIGTAERVSAIVEMNHPGVWVLGDLSDDDRERGMGIVIEYAGYKGKPVWEKPEKAEWDYSMFGHSGPPSMKPVKTFDLLFAKDQSAIKGFNRWTINGKSLFMGDLESMKPLLHLSHGQRYRLRMRNASDDIHPMHLHRHIFEVTKFAGKPMSGVHKDVVMVGGFQEVEIDFTADQLGLSLFHCHQQLHMDFGFMALFRCS